MRLLDAGSESDRLWALDYVSEAGLQSSMPSLTASLEDHAESAQLRLMMLGTLARFNDPAAIAPLSSALRADPAPEVRSPCAQAPGRISHVTPVQGLAAAAPDESDSSVRIEIVHALARYGAAACDALWRIARRDPDYSVRTLGPLSFDSDG